VPAAEPLTEVVRGLVTRARAAGAVLVHLQNDGPAGAVDEPGTPGWELYLPIQKGPDEVVVRKTDDDGFDGTDLGGLLTAASRRWGHPPAGPAKASVARSSASRRAGSSGACPAFSTIVSVAVRQTRLSSHAVTAGVWRS
jgi:hypothetical protein